MKRGWILAIIAANLVVMVGLIFAYPHLMVAPGPLVKAHSDINTDCFACHAPLRGVASERCVTCHALPDIGLRTTKGAPVPKSAGKTSFHQDLLEQNCSACHSDHQAPRLTQRVRKPFSHALLRTETRDRCETCHKGPMDTLHRQISGNCAQCHTPQQWKPATFNHDKFFLLDKDHNATCVTCHTNNDYSRYTCYSCHEHTPANILREHQKEGIKNFDNCVECHRSADGEPNEGGKSESREKSKRD